MRNHEPFLRDVPIGDQGPCVGCTRICAGEGGCREAFSQTKTSALESVRHANHPTRKLRMVGSEGLLKGSD